MPLMPVKLKVVNRHKGPDIFESDATDMEFANPMQDVMQTFDAKERRPRSPRSPKSPRSPTSPREVEIPLSGSISPQFSTATVFESDDTEPADTVVAK